MRNTDVGIVAVEIKHSANQEQQWKIPLRLKLFFGILKW